MSQRSALSSPSAIWLPRSTARLKASSKGSVSSVLRVGGHDGRGSAGQTAMIPESRPPPAAESRENCLKISRFRALRCRPSRARRRARARRRRGPGGRPRGARPRFRACRPGRRGSRSRRRPDCSASVALDVGDRRFEQRALGRVERGASDSSRCRSRSVCCRSLMAGLRRLSLGQCSSAGAAPPAVETPDRARCGHYNATLDSRSRGTHAAKNPPFAALAAAGCRTARVPAAPALADSPRFELTPFVGARVGGRLRRRHDDERHGRIGRPRLRRELRHRPRPVSRQPVVLRTALFDADRRARLERPCRGRRRPAASTTCSSAARCFSRRRTTSSSRTCRSRSARRSCEPDGDYDSETKFSGSLGGGFRFPFNDNVAREPGRARLPDVASNPTPTCSASATRRRRGCLVQVVGQHVLPGRGVARAQRPLLTMPARPRARARQ